MGLFDSLFGKKTAKNEIRKFIWYQRPTLISALHAVATGNIDAFRETVRGHLVELMALGDPREEVITALEELASKGSKRFQFMVYSFLAAATGRSQDGAVTLLMAAVPGDRLRLRIAAEEVEVTVSKAMIEGAAQGVLEKRLY